MPCLVAPEVKLNYIQFGRGEDLVLIHGLGANLSFWYFGAGRLLGQTHNVLAYDLRGHGRSSMPPTGYDLNHMVDDLIALLNFLNIDRIDLVGHSFGGRVALAFAVLHPERVRNLVIADSQLRTLQPSMRLSEWAHWHQWKAELTSQGLTNLPPDESFISHSLLVQLSHAHGNVANEGRRRISLRTRDMGEKGLERWQGLMTETSAGKEFEDDSFLIPSILEKISMPTLLVFGKFSHCLPTAERLLDCLPNSRLILAPGAGHFIPIVKPRFFARAIDTFLRRQQNSATPVFPGNRVRRAARRRFGRGAV